MKAAVILLSVILLAGCFGAAPKEEQKMESKDLPDSFNVELGVGKMPTLPDAPEGLEDPEIYSPEEPDFGSII